MFPHLLTSESSGPGAAVELNSVGRRPAFTSEKRKRGFCEAVFGVVKSYRITPRNERNDVGSAKPLVNALSPL